MKLFLISIAATVALSSSYFDANSSRLSCASSASSVSSAPLHLVDRDNARDLEGVLAGYTDDAVLLPPNREILIGKAALRRNYQRLFSGSENINLSSAAVESRAEGNLGYVRGITRGMITPAGGGERVLVKDKFIALVRCEAGQWRVSHLMWSPETSTP